MRTLCILLFLCISTAAAGEERDREACRLEGMMAETFMKHRQNGIWDIDQQFDKFGEVPGLRPMILEAYSYPLMQTAETKAISIDEFRNKWMVDCYRDGPSVDWPTD